MRRQAALLTLVLSGLMAFATHAHGQDEGSAPPRLVDLNEAISLGLTRSPQIKAAQHATQKAALVVDQAEWAWTPKLELSSAFAPMPKVGLYDVDEKAYSDLSEWGFFIRNAFEVSVPIFTFFKISTLQELAGIGLDVERLREEEQRAKVTYDVVRAFYGLQFANAAMNVADEADALLRRVENEYEKLWAAQSPSVSRTDRYRIEIAAADMAIATNELRLGRELAKQGLRLHTNLDDNFRIPGMRFRADDVELLPLEEVLALAHGQRIDLQLLSQAELASERSAHLEWLKWWPDFALVARLNYAYSNAVPEIEEKTIYVSDPYNAFSFAVVLAMRWKIDPVNQVFKVAEADADLARTRAQIELARRGVALEVEKLYGEAQNAQQRVQLVYASRRAAKRFMTQELVDYEVGGGKVDDVISAVRRYIELRLHYLSALQDFRLAVARLRLATGAQSPDQLLTTGTLEDYLSDAARADDSPEDE